MGFFLHGTYFSLYQHATLTNFLFREFIMPIERDEVEKIAHLARLSLTAEQIPLYASSLSKIIDLVAQINEAQTDHIEPMAHPLENITQRLREDKVTEENQRELFQSIAPQTEAGLYLVPKVIEE
jgi:aspartyl-tRNA(Asn)/glutamyl-tRNA(Gln) amidotransferase subunit C